MAQDRVAHQDQAEHQVVQDKQAHQDQVALRDPVERQDLVALDLEHLDLPVVALARQQVGHQDVRDQLVAVAVEPAQPVLLVRVDRVASPASPSAPREKNSNKEKHRA